MKKCILINEKSCWVSEPFYLYDDEFSSIKKILKTTEKDVKIFCVNDVESFKILSEAKKILADQLKENVKS